MVGESCFYRNIRSTIARSVAAYTTQMSPSGLHMLLHYATLSDRSCRGGGSAGDPPATGVGGGEGAAEDTEDGEDGLVHLTP